MQIENNIGELLDKVILGDCLALLDKLPDNCIDLIYSDLPYNERTIHYSDDPSDPNNFPRPQYLEWVKQVVSKLVRVSRGYIALQIGEGYDIERVGTLQKAYTNEGLIPNDLSLIWQTKGSDYGSRLVIGSKNRPVIRLNKRYWDLRNVQYPRVLRSVHPATTCPDIAKTLIELYTRESDVVLDICNGIGTTTRASKSLNRHFIGFELKDWREEFLEKDPTAKWLGREDAVKYYESIFKL